MYIYTKQPAYDFTSKSRKIKAYVNNTYMKNNGTANLIF